MSKIIPKFKATIKDNKLILDNPKLFALYLGGLEGKIVNVIVNKHKKTRSDRANRYLWAYYNLISEETGDNANDLHEYLKRKLLPPRIIEVLGKEVKLPASTTKLSTDDFTKYITDIENLTGIPAPDPNEYYVN